MKKFLIFTLSIIMVFSLAACAEKDESKKEKAKSTSAGQSLEKKENSNKEDKSAKKTEESEKEKKEALTKKKAKKGKEEQEELYLGLIKDALFNDLGFDDSFEISLQAYDDFDNDDIIEAVIGLKNPSNSNMVSQLLYIKINDDSIEALDQKDVSEMMYITDCRLISVKDMDSKVICIDYSKGELLKVFDLYSLENDNINLLFSGLPYGLSGEASIVDNDNDEIYEGYKTEAYGIDVYYNSLYQDFEFYKDEYFSSKCTSALIELYDYPENIKDIVLEYCSLSEIRNNIIPTVPIKNLDERLGKLAKGGFINDTDYLYDSSLLKNTFLEIEPKLDFDVEINDKKATAKASILGDIHEEDHVYVNNLISYELERNNKTGKWLITNQTFMPYNNSSEIVDSLSKNYDKRLIWGDDPLEDRKYSLDFDGQYKGEISLYNEPIHESNDFVVVHTYPIYDKDDEENTAFIQRLFTERQLDWYFVEFPYSSSIYDYLRGEVYIMTEAGFDEFMRTGEVVESNDMQLVAFDSPTKDVLEKNQKGWHHYIEISGDIDNPEIIYHGYSNLVETNYYERFIWKRGLGLTGYLSGFGAEKDVIILEYLD